MSLLCYVIQKKHFHFILISFLFQVIARYARMAVVESQWNSNSSSSISAIQHTHQCHFSTQRAAIELCMLSYAETHFDYGHLCFSLLIFKVIQRKAKE